MVLKPVGTQNTPKKQYNMDTRIAKNPSEIPQSHNDFGESIYVRYCKYSIDDLAELSFSAVLLNKV